MATIDYKQKIIDYMNSSEVDTLYKSMLNNLFPELKESEDERIRKELIEQVVYIVPNDDEVDSECNVLPIYQKRIDKYRAWLEKQGEHANFRNKIEIGDKVTRNKDGVLVNLSQLNRVAKKQGKQETLCDKCRKEQPSHSCQDITELGRCALEKQGEQKPVWSEEDELIVAKILCICNDFERSFESSPSSMKVIKEDVDKIDTWLKSLRPQNRWKPSDEQMNALRYVTNFDYGGHKATLVSLYEQLKKLK